MSTSTFNRIYMGVIEKSLDGYSIYFPDFPGCGSGGDDINHVVAMGIEALQFHIEGLVEDGEALPEPSLVNLADEVAAYPDADIVSVVATPVEIPIAPSHVRVSLETTLVREIDALNLNRQKFLADAVRKELARLQKSA